MPIPRPSPARIPTLLLDTRGASVIELALVIPLLSIMFMGMVDASRIIARGHQLEQATQRAIEKATSYGQNGSDFSDIDDEAAIAAGVTTDDVTVDYWLECEGVRQTDFYGVCGSGKEISRHILVAVEDGYTPIFPYGPLGGVIGMDPDGSIPLTADASVRIQ